MKQVQQLCLCTPTKGLKMKHKNGSRLSAAQVCLCGLGAG